MSKVAKLVTVILITRVIVDNNASEEEILEIAKPRLRQKLNDEMFENIESIVNDVDSPYDEKND